MVVVLCRWCSLVDVGVRWLTLVFVGYRWYTYDDFDIRYNVRVYSCINVQASHDRNRTLVRYYVLQSQTNVWDLTKVIHNVRQSYPQARLKLSTSYPHEH